MTSLGGRVCCLEGVGVCLTPLLCAGVRLEQLCQAGGQCVDKDRSHYCVCAEGRTGSHCEQEVDPCAGQPCQHGGTCHGYVGGYVCQVRGAQGCWGDTSVLDAGSILRVSLGWCV